jgi:hypothetical protein
MQYTRPIVIPHQRHHSNRRGDRLRPKFARQPINLVDHPRKMLPCSLRGSGLLVRWHSRHLHYRIDGLGRRVLTHLFEVRSKRIIKQKLCIRRTDCKGMKRFGRDDFL